MAPICVFVYNRLQETKRLFKSLLDCKESENAEIFVFSDGPKNADDYADVEKVRLFVKQISGFKSINLHFSDVNKGLKQSVIEGVTAVFNKHDSIIVLEDDLVLSNDFVVFMNDCLNIYRERKDIWSISGYTPNISIPQDYMSDVFVVQRAQSWGWATWKDRWDSVEWDLSGCKITKAIKHEFDKGGDDMSRLLDMQKHGKIDSWAICWCYAQFLQKKLTVNPTKSKVRNIGFADSATNNGLRDVRHDVDISNEKIRIDAEVRPNEEIMSAFKAHHDLDMISKIGYFMRRYNLGYHVVKKFLKRIR